MTKPYQDLRDFITQLKAIDECRTIVQPISPLLEMTEISQRVLHQQGPALLFENPRHQKQSWAMPVLTNLFGTPHRVALGMGCDDVAGLRDVGHLLADIKNPRTPDGLKGLWKKWPLLQRMMTALPKIVTHAPCRSICLEGDAVDLGQLPLQQCWPSDVSPLLTWGLTITRGPHKSRQNIGIYRQQPIARNKLIMRWLAHRGGALDFKDFQALYPQENFPVAVALGCDPATLLAAVMPIPDVLSEYQFAGLLRGQRTELVRCLTGDLMVPARSEIVLEGYIAPGETALEGPFGDHTGYYNEQERFPVFTVTCMSMRDNPIYHSTYTGKPPDEPAVLGLALNEVFIPLLQQQFPEIVDFYLPPEGCSYRVMVVSIRKQFPGHARSIMMGCWGFLRQFMYTKFMIVVDDDINIRDWPAVIWAISTRADPVRDTLLIDQTPIDYLDFASPTVGLGSKMGLDATNKLPSETTRCWGTPIAMDTKTKKRIDGLWAGLGL